MISAIFTSLSAFSLWYKVNIRHAFENPTLKYVNMYQQKFKTKENSDSGLCYYSIEASNNKKLS